MKALAGELSRTVERTAMIAVVVVLLATNVLSIMSPQIHESLYDLLSHIPYEGLLNNSPIKKQRQVEADNQMLRKKQRQIEADNQMLWMKQKLVEANNQMLREQNRGLISKLNAHHAKLNKARAFSQRIAKRTARNLAFNVTSIPEEAAPYLGAAMVVTVAAADVIDGCETVRDVNEMLRILEIDPIDDHESEVCGIKVPNVDEVLANIKQDIGGTVYHAKERTMESVREFYDALGGTLYEILK